MKNEKQKTEFSKSLLIWETILIWVVTLAFIGLAIFCVIRDYVGELAWLGAIYAFPWAAYAVSQACYYRKAEKENTKGGIKFETTLATLKPLAETITEAVDEILDGSQEQESDDEEALG